MSKGSRTSFSLSGRVLNSTTWTNERVSLTGGETLAAPPGPHMHRAHREANLMTWTSLSPLITYRKLIYLFLLGRACWMQNKKFTPKCFTINTMYSLLSLTHFHSSVPCWMEAQSPVAPFRRAWVTLIRRPTSNCVRLASLQSTTSTSIPLQQ